MISLHPSRRFRLMSLRAAALLTLLLAAACARARPRTATRPESVSGPPAVAPAPDRSGRSAVAGDATLEHLRRRALMVPVEGVKVSEVAHTFDERRGDRAHNAHDIMASKGTAVLAADDGRIIRLSSNALGGITIYATDPSEKLVYYYAHLDRYARGLQAGKKVRKGEIIGYVGSSGNASPSAPHLHFQVARMTDISRHWEGIPIDARPYFAEDGRRRR